MVAMKGKWGYDSRDATVVVMEGKGGYGSRGTTVVVMEGGGYDSRSVMNSVTH